MLSSAQGALVIGFWTRIGLGYDQNLTLQLYDSIGRRVATSKLKLVGANRLGIRKGALHYVDGAEQRARRPARHAESAAFEKQAHLGRRLEVPSEGSSPSLAFSLSDYCYLDSCRSADA